MKKDTPDEDVAEKDCFVIMPIADHEEYEKGHFKKVYEDIFKPACERCGFRAVRADDVTQTNLIHEDILRKLIESPIAICDLSSRNPNVLFELGLRQAFDKPTVLVQDKGTPRIFDIAPLRYTEYRRELKYREVLEDQKAVEVSLSSTWAASLKGEGINSIVRILSLSSPASLKSIDENDTSSMLALMRAEMSEMRSDFRRAIFTKETSIRETAIRERARGLPNGSPISEAVREIFKITDLFDGMESKDFSGSISFENIANISLAQKSLLAIIDSDLPEKIREDAKQLFDRSQALERNFPGVRSRIRRGNKSPE